MTDLFGKAEAERLDYIQFIFIDLFCGAGGTTIGAEDTETLPEDLVAFLRANKISLPKDRWKETFFKICKVVACVNHDPIAIRSHWRNHPWVEHFEEDIRLLDPYKRLKRLIEIYRAFYPHAKIIIWGSLECTHFSKAKGGESRDQDSRTLAYELYHYIHALDPDYVLIENVVEFMAWGPLVHRVGKTPEGYPFSYLKVKKKKGSIEVGPSWVPESSKNGKDWLKWRETINSFGYHDEWKQINAADHGAMTSRNRLFGCFARTGLPIVWPAATHSKNPSKTSMVTPMKKWNAVKHALDFEDEGTSIFNRYKGNVKIITTKDGHLFCKLRKYDAKYCTFGPVPDPLVKSTMQRIFMGAVKHIAGGKKAYEARLYGTDSTGIKTENFITKNFSGKPEYKNASIDDPSQTITGFGAGNLIKVQPFIDKAFGGDPTHMSSTVDAPWPVITTKPTQNKLIFLSTYNSNKPKEKGGGNAGRSIEEPAPVIPTRNLPILVCSKHFIQKYYTSGVNINSIEDPAPTVPCADVLGKITFNPFRDSGQHQSIEDPAGSILQNDKHNLVTLDKWIMATHRSGDDSHAHSHSLEQPSPALTASRHHHYLMNPAWFNQAIRSTNEPCWVIVARQDKAPLGMIVMKTGGPIAIPIYDDDCEWTIKLKEFMVLYNIVDIKMRMLKVIELKKIQGFPENYYLGGNQSDQKKFIGNSVCPVVPKRWLKAFSVRYLEYKSNSLRFDFEAKAA